MRMRTIEVDEEVFEHLKSRAEPLIDSSNDVLRRLLLGKKGKLFLHPADLPEIPVGTPKALGQILSVCWLTLNTPLPRIQATQRVADLNNVSFQTVTDKCCRQLDLSARQFDEILAEPEVPRLSAILADKYPKESEIIDRMLK